MSTAPLAGLSAAVLRLSTRKAIFKLKTCTKELGVRASCEEEDLAALVDVHLLLGHYARCSMLRLPETVEGWQAPLSVQQGRQGPGGIKGQETTREQTLAFSRLIIRSIIGNCLIRQTLHLRVKWRAGTMMFRRNAEYCRLTKRGGVIKNWKKRYFRLSLEAEPSLSYHKGEEPRSVAKGLCATCTLHTACLPMLSIQIYWHAC